MAPARSRPKRPRTSAAPPGRRGRRRLYIAGIALLLVPVIILGHGFLRHALHHPRVDATVERTDMFVKAGEHIQIEVVNACGVDGMATKFTEFLRARKFDVVEYSNARSREPYSRVIDRIGDSASARKVAYALGIAEKHIDTEIDSSRYLRASVVIGLDYQGLRPAR